MNECMNDRITTKVLAPAYAQAQQNKLFQSLKKLILVRTRIISQRLLRYCEK